MRPQLEVGRAAVVEARMWSLGQGSLVQLSCCLMERRTELLGFLPWLSGGDGRRCTRLRFRREGEDGRLLWFLGLLWHLFEVQMTGFIRNLEFIPLKIGCQEWF